MPKSPLMTACVENFAQPPRPSCVSWNPWVSHEVGLVEHNPKTSHLLAVSQVIWSLDVRDMEARVVASICTCGRTNRDAD